MTKEIKQRILEREVFFGKEYGRYGGRNRKKAARVEMVYLYTGQGVKWVKYRDTYNNTRTRCLTRVGFEILHNQPVQRECILFYDILTENTVVMKANCMPEYMNKLLIDIYKRKLTVQERKRIEDEEEKISKKTRDKNNPGDDPAGSESS